MTDAAAGRFDALTRRAAVIKLRSLAFNLAFYVNLVALMILGLPSILIGRHGVFSMARLWGSTSRLAARGDLRPARRVSRSRKHSRGRLYPRRQTRVFPGNLRAAQTRARLRHRAQAPTRFHSDLRTLSRRRPADRHRPRARPCRAGADHRPGARRPRRRPPGLHFSRGHPPPARRAAALQIRRRRPLHGNRRPLPSRRHQHRPLLGPTRFCPSPRRGGDRIPAADPSRPRSRRLRRAPANGDRVRPAIASTPRRSPPIPASRRFWPPAPPRSTPAKSKTPRQ